MLIRDIQRQDLQLTLVQEDFDDLQAANARAEIFNHQKDDRY
jgi:hypothetical protein